MPLPYLILLAESKFSCAKVLSWRVRIYSLPLICWACICERTLGYCCQQQLLDIRHTYSVHNPALASITQRESLHNLAKSFKNMGEVQV